jgi:cell division protein FtsI (penicillin-binding protein 3)
VTTYATPRSNARARAAKPVVRERAIRRYQPVDVMPDARRFLALGVALLLLLSVVVVKLIVIQGVQHDRFAGMSISQTRKTFQLAAMRGSILDRNGRDLALSIEKATLFADPSLVEDPLGEAKTLSPLLGIPVKTLQAKLTQPGRFVYLARKVDDTIARKVKAAKLPGISAIKESARLRPSADLAAPIIGNVGLDNEGLGGIEHQYEAQLKGKPGSIEVDADSHLRRIATGEAIVNPSVAGHDLVLTIDRGLQYEAERLLRQEIVSSHAKGGIALVMDTNTGDILAMANLTTDAKTGEVNQALRNMAVTDVYEPGSVNKLITMAGALEDGVVHVDDRLTVPDRMKVGNHVFSDHDPHATMGMSPTDIMRESSNIGSILVAQKLGRDRLADYLSNFGFGVKPGLGFPGESGGILRPASKWYSTDMGSIPIGQGVSVSALQMLAAYNAVANGGKYVAPRLVKATIDGNGVSHPIDEAPSRRVVSTATATSVTGMLEEVVKSGTGTLAQIPGYRVAGKTGTARKPAPGGTGYLDGKYMSSFAGFAPADRPEISALVMLDEPTPIFGGLVAAPVFSELARTVLRELRIPPSREAMTTSAPTASIGEQVVRGDGDAPASSTTSSTVTTACCSTR